MKMGITAAAGLLSMAVLAAVSGCGKTRNGGSPEKIPVVKGITLHTTQEEAIPDMLETTGTVKARNSAVIAARIPGAVTSVQVREGEHVAKGKLLVTIAAAESSAGALGARAGIEEALRGVEEARARKTLAETTLQRYQKLLQEQAVTRQEFDERTTERDVAVQGLARMEARLVQSRESGNAASAVAGYTRIVAPFSGLVTGRSADPGMTVFPGTPLLSLEEEGGYRLEASVPASFSGKVKPGDSLQVTMDDAAGSMVGKVTEVAPAIDPASRTFTVKIDLAAQGLRSGSFGRAYFPVGTRRGLLVPKKAVMERGALNMVWVVGKDNIARMRLIKTGASVMGRTEVLAGLSPGERIVADGTERIADGAKVE